MIGAPLFKAGMMLIFLLCLAADPATAAIKVKKKYPTPDVDESKALCEPGGDIKQKRLNPTACGQAGPSEADKLRWHLTSISAGAEENYFRTQYAPYCATGQNGLMQCFFFSGVQACNAYVAAQQALYPIAGKTPYTTAGKYAAEGIYHCTYCQKGDKKDAQGYCSYGDNLIFQEAIPLEATAPFCTNQANGPYSLSPDRFAPCGTTHTTPAAGMIFTKDQRTRIRSINKGGTSNPVKSDLAGFCYPHTGSKPCLKDAPGKPGVCMEPSILEQSGSESFAQVHHVIPRVDKRSCPCGANANANAALISAQLNRFFTNNDRTNITDLCSGKTELDFVNSLNKYPASP